MADDNVRAANYATFDEGAPGQEGDVEVAVAGPVIQRSHFPIIASCCCGCCFVFVGLIASQVIAVSMLATCSSATGTPRPTWNEVLPPVTTAQTQYRLFSLFFNKVKVYSGNATRDDKEVGQWTDVQFLFDIQTRLSYVDKATNVVQFQARSPFGFYFGRRFHLWSCSNLATEYRLEEDWWARPWFNLNSEATFTMKKVANGTTQDAAICHIRRDSVFSFRGSFFTATCKTPSGEVVAEINQETQSDAGWFSYQRWFDKNLRPDVLPNEVVSFLSVVWDMEFAHQSHHSSSGSGSSSRGGGGFGGAPAGR